jgi:hypothetical protein
VNNSWACAASEGCDLLVLQSSFAALREAGILAVAAAGNSGSSCSTVDDPPAIYEDLFVVGATTSSDLLANFSSRGPVTVDGSGRLRPDVAAPGVDVRSAIRGDTYAFMNGTSMASPHAAAAAALLWSAKPQVRGLVDISRCVLSESARVGLQLSVAQTCGEKTAADRPNNFWGFGLVDAYAAVHLGPDPDVDGIASACDCAPGSGGVFDEPGEIEGLRFDATKSTLYWDSAAPMAGVATVYDVVRGDLLELRLLGTVEDAGCLSGGSTAVSEHDADVPAVGAGFYYLVQARNVCGVGGWGEAGGVPRAHTTCP